jgi:hypothetical protein
MTSVDFTRTVTGLPVASSSSSAASSVIDETTCWLRANA